jgi:hypothetical protein
MAILVYGLKMELFALSMCLIGSKTVLYSSIFRIGL